MLILWKIPWMTKGLLSNYSDSTDQIVLAWKCMQYLRHHQHQYVHCNHVASRLSVYQLRNQVNSGIGISVPGATVQIVERKLL